MRPPNSLSDVPDTPELLRTDSLATLVEATDLLNIELPDRRWSDQTHLEWLYGANPYGRGIYGFRREGARLDAHYAHVPQLYRTPNGPMRMMFSLNAVTRAVGQRRGHFWSIAEELFARDLAEYGAQGIIGVSNDNSTPPVVRKLDFRLLGPLPVRVVPRGRGIGAGVGQRVGQGVGSDAVDHHLVDLEFLASETATAAFEDLDHPVEWGWRNVASPEYLRWRLASPNTAPFSVHVTDELVAVSTTSHLGPVPAAVILKLMPRRPLARPLFANRLISSICAHHGAPFAVYAGFNARVVVRGFQPPRRLQPAPLNLIYRSLTPVAAKHGFRLETFEFLDMDAY